MNDIVNKGSPPPAWGGGVRGGGLPQGDVVAKVVLPPSLTLPPVNRREEKLQKDIMMTAQTTIDQHIDVLFKGLADISEAVLFYSLKFDVPNAAGEAVTKEFPLILLWLVAAGVLSHD